MTLKGKNLVGGYSQIPVLKGIDFSVVMANWWA